MSRYIQLPHRLTVTKVRIYNMQANLCSLAPQIPLGPIAAYPPRQLLAVVNHRKEAHRDGKKIVEELNVQDSVSRTAREESVKENQDIKVKAHELEKQIKITRLELQSA